MSFKHSDNIKSVIMSTVSNINIDEIHELIDLVTKYEVDIYSFARYCTTSLDKNNFIKSDEYKKLLESCWNKFEEYNDEHTSFSLKDHL